MISIKKARTLLSKEYDNKSDQEIQELLYQLYALADLIFEYWEIKKKQNNMKK